MHQQNRDEYRGRCEVFVFAAAQNKWLFASEPIDKDVWRNKMLSTCEGGECDV